jgi:hypothetical protein
MMERCHPDTIDLRPQKSAGERKIANFHELQSKQCPMVIDNAHYRVYNDSDFRGQFLSMMATNISTKASRRTQ